MKKWKLKRDTYAALDPSGMHVSSLWQIPQDDGRKLKQVAQPGDPWIAQLFYGDCNSIHAEFITWAQGETADAAVENALLKSRGLEGQYRKLAAESEILRKLLRHVRGKAKAA